MEMRPAVSRDIDTIWPHLAQRMLDEYRLAKIANPALAKAIFRKDVKAGRGVAFVNGESEVLAVMTWQSVDEGVATSFAGTDTFFTPPFVRPFSRLMRRFQGERGNCRIVCHSYSVHPAVEKWFLTLGFKLQGQDGAHRVFMKSPFESA